ncbi:hypothetical protein GCM10009721_31930 [Terrabacter tumescens]|uniref:Sugar ABC transporter ATPase n=1 Tax=Terrabacter tumescens TaxID=60443 RepID=A0ABQ2I9T8_9MICO|nr:hypothetical protein [Terrabacter tumescens]GGN02359.1 hypothetical protein GCM10009721_31930 [Terrabacter tumescens]
MDTSRAADSSTPDPSEFDGGQPESTDAEELATGRPDTDGPDVLFPDTLRPSATEGALPAADEGDLVEQQVDVPEDDDEDERRD